MSTDFCHGPRRRLKAMAMVPPIQDVTHSLIIELNRQEYTCLQW